MRNRVFLLPLLLACSLWGCQKTNSFVPARGAIEGKAIDNNGKLLEGIQVTATFLSPSQGGQTITKTTLTDALGIYRIKDLLGIVELRVEDPRFNFSTQKVDLSLNDQPNVDFMLTGSPTIHRVELNKLTLAPFEPDSIFVRIEATDLFNSSPSHYQGNVLVQNDQDFTEAEFIAQELSREGNEMVLSGHIFGNKLPMGTYTILVMVYDPDGNKHQFRAEQVITKG